MPKERPCVLSIAGFDPSGGAGILADIKTFEQHKVLGMGVVTGLTFQNDSEFESVKWVVIDEIIRQIEILTRRYKFDFIKIGMLESLESLEAIIESCNLKMPNSKIIWDPIIKASVGFEIHKSVDKKKVMDVCKNLYLITPNVDEIRILTEEQDEMKGGKQLSSYCHVFLKGGHSRNKKGYDYLFTTEGDEFSFRPKKITELGKHGTGCIISSAITANLANGFSLHRSCLKGKDYVTKFLFSNKTVLGYHKL